MLSTTGSFGSTRTGLIFSQRVRLSQGHFKEKAQAGDGRVDGARRDPVIRPAASENGAGLLALLIAGECPKNRAKRFTARMYESWVLSPSLRIVMSSIMR
ncbi:MAG: hypothetical protein U5K38_02830 [Woeseiaceae bacterium]|nr:hypothetical protein [Woeseiaceae bacterium]